MVNSLVNKRHNEIALFGEDTHKSSDERVVCYEDLPQHVRAAVQQFAGLVEYPVPRGSVDWVRSIRTYADCEFPNVMGHFLSQVGERVLCRYSVLRFNYTGPTKMCTLHAASMYERVLEREQESYEFGLPFSFIDAHDFLMLPSFVVQHMALALPHHTFTHSTQMLYRHIGGKVSFALARPELTQRRVLILALKAFMLKAILGGRMVYASGEEQEEPVNKYFELLCCLFQGVAWVVGSVVGVVLSLWQMCSLEWYRTLPPAQQAFLDVIICILVVNLVLVV